MDASERKEIERIIEKYLLSQRAGTIWLRGNLSGIPTSPKVIGITDALGNSLNIGSIADGEYLKRSGSTVISAAPTAAPADISLAPTSSQTILANTSRYVVDWYEIVDTLYTEIANTGIMEIG